jgi:DNA/RNA-binding domain of Phe-tRNA-synthetase-like protein
VTEAGNPRPIPLSITAGLRGRVRVGTLEACPVAVGPTGEDLQREIDGFAVELRARYSGRSPAEISEIAPARELYRTFAIDPTKTRPSSEKLLRRVLRKQPLPRISNAVDLGNLLALRFLLPIGLFDSEKIDGSVELRPGLPGESYEGIGSRPVHLEGRPALADERGAFGNPTADSRRTAVEAASRSLWMTVFAPASFPVADLEGHLRRAAEDFRRYLSGADPALTRTGLVE